MDTVEKTAKLNQENNIPIDVGYVYVLQAANGLYKIGKTHNLKARMKSIQTASPVKIEVYRVFKSVHCAFAERDLHEFFAAAREIGEWFRLTDEQLDEFNRWSDEWGYLVPCYL